MKKNKEIEKILFGEVDLSPLQKWSGEHVLLKEDYLDFLENKKKEGKDIHCIEFCSGCGRVLSMEKDLAFDFYHDVFSGEADTFIEKLRAINKSEQYIKVDVCDNCAKSMLEQGMFDKLKIIPIIENI